VIANFQMPIADSKTFGFLNWQLALGNRKWR